MGFGTDLDTASFSGLRVGSAGVWAYVQRRRALCEDGSMELTDRFNRALVRAAEIHRHQIRKCSEGDPEIPYISHLLNVCGLVLQDGGSEDEAIAALLHDAPEDQGGEPMLEEIEAEFGPNVAKIVTECSDTFEHPKPPWRQGRDQQLWYYRSLVTTYREIDGFESPMINELDRVVTELEGVVDRKTNNL